MGSGTYVWARVIQLPVYVWMSCSSNHGMYGEACVHYGCRSIDTVLSLFLGCRTFLFGVLYVKELYVFVMSCTYLYI